MRFADERRVKSIKEQGSPYEKEDVEFLIGLVEDLNSDLEEAEEKAEKLQQEVEELSD